MGIRGDLVKGLGIAAVVTALVVPAGAEGAVSFTPRSPVSVGADGKDLVAIPRGDTVDLAALNFGTGLDPSTISVIQGPALSTVSQTLQTGAGEKLRAVTAGDFDGDGDLDLVGLGDKAFYYAGNGTGGYAAGVPTTLSGGTFNDVASGHWDGDGKLDLFTAAQSGATTQVFRGNGDGTFQTTADSEDTSSGNRLALGDLAGDARMEIAAVSESAGTLSIMRRSSLGELEKLTGSPFTIGGSSLLRPGLGDLDGDADVDAAIPSYGSMGGAGFVRVKVLINDGAGGGTVSEVAASDLTNASAVAVADVDNDGAADLAVTDQGANELVPLLGTGNGTAFDDNPMQPETGSQPVDVVAADFDGDGNPDLASLDTVSSQVSVFDATAPTLLRSTATADFGTAAVGAPAATRTVRISNAGGNNPRLLAEFSITGAAAADFEIVTNGCEGVRLVPGGAGCDVVLGFTPGAAGARQAELQIESNAADSPHSIVLVGSGTCAPEQEAVDAAAAALGAATAARQAAFKKSKKAKRKLKAAKRKLKAAGGDEVGKAKKAVQKASKKSKKAKRKLRAARAAEEAARAVLTEAEGALERCLSTR